MQSARARRRRRPFVCCARGGGGPQQRRRAGWAARCGLRAASGLLGEGRTARQALARRSRLPGRMRCADAAAHAVRCGAVRRSVVLDDPAAGQAAAAVGGRRRGWCAVVWPGWWCGLAGGAMRRLRALLLCALLLLLAGPASWNEGPRRGRPGHTSLRPRPVARWTARRRAGGQAGRQAGRRACLLRRAQHSAISKVGQVPAGWCKAEPDHRGDLAAQRAKGALPGIKSDGDRANAPDGPKSPARGAPGASSHGTIQMPAASARRLGSPTNDSQTKQARAWDGSRRADARPCGWGR